MAERSTDHHGQQEPVSLEGDDGAPLLGESSEIDESVRDDGAPRLLAVLNWWDGVGVSVGVVVGSGIFASPGQMMQHVGSTGLSLVAWGLACVVALCSSLVYAELAPMMPTAGGDRDYISAAFGGTISFAYSATMFIVIKPGALAILSVTFARYAAALLYPGQPVTDADLLVKALAVGSVLALTALNCSGIRESSAVQNFLTSTKAILLAIIIAAAGVSLSTPEGREIANENLGSGAFRGSNLSGLGPALIGALWAFDGWNDIVFMAEELKQPNMLPLIIVLSLFICALIYVLMCLCYDAVLSAAAITSSSTIALETVQGTLGNWAFVTIGVLVSVSVLGSLNASVMTGGRLFFAGGRDGDLPAVMATLSKGTRAPWVALIAQATVVCVLLLLPGSSFNNLVAYFGSASWLWYGTTGACLLVLRHTKPDAHRPYRCPLFCAWLTIGTAAYLIGSSAWDPSTRLQTFTSIGFIVAALAFSFVRQVMAPPTKPSRSNSESIMEQQQL